MDKTKITLQDVKEAADRIGPYISHTPLLRENTMDKFLGCQVYLKPEMLQVSGAFKMRGALNKILSLTPEEKAKGIITSSSGNHGQSCAYIGQMLGIHVTVVVPEDAPAIKIKNAKAMGADVIVWKRKYVERMKKVREEIAEHNYILVHPYEDYLVMAGQGTIGLEILDDLPEIDSVLVPIGGGGLISGISTAIKESSPNVRVIGVQAEACGAFYESRRNGHPSEIVPRPTVADGLTAIRVSDFTYPIIEKNVDEIVGVEEEDIKEAVRLVAREAKLVAEPSASVGIAALASGKVKTRLDEKICIVLTAGNWDINMIGMILKGEHVAGIQV